MINFSIKGVTTVAILGGMLATAVSTASAAALTPGNCAYSFNTNMRLGSRGADVMNLQKVLNMYSQTQVSASGAGSPGMETSTFGPATRRAVNKLQALYLVELGVSAPTGNVFAGTRGVLNGLCNGTVSTTPGNPGTPVVTGPVSAMLGANQPSTFLISGQAAGRIAEFTLSGTGVVKAVKLMRVGLSDDTTLTNVYLYEGMTRVAGPASVSRDGSVIFNSANGLFAVTGMKNITVRGDVATNKSGNTIGFALVGLDTGMGMTSFNGVTGPQLQIGSVDLAGVDMPTGAAVLPSAQSLNAGSMVQNLWERNVNVSKRTVNLTRAQFKMIGSAPSTSIANAKLNVDGMDIASGMVDSNGVISFVPTTPFALTTGGHTVKVFADIVGGSDRSFYVSLENASDILLEDSQVTGAYVMYTVASASTATSNLLGGTISIQGGSLVITQDTSINAVTTVVGGASNQTLAKWKVTSYGEDVKITTISFMPTITGTGSSISNVGMYVDGAQVRSNQTANTATTLVYTDLGTNFTVPTGKTVMVELRGDLITSTGTAFTTGSVKFDVTTGTAQGIYSQKVSTLAAATGQTKTIGTSNVTFAIAAGSAAKTVAPSSSAVKIGSFVLQTGSAEGVNVTSFAATVPGSLLTTSKLTNLTLKDGSTMVGNIIGLPVAGDNTFSANIVVPMSTTKTFDLYADISSGSAGATTTPTLKVFYTGSVSRVSGSSAYIAGVSTTANVGTISAPTVTFVPASSPVSQFVLGGANLMIAKFNVKSLNGVAGATLKDLVFTVPANTVSSISVNGKSANVVGTTATIFDSGFAIPSDASGVDLNTTATLVCVNPTAGCAGVSSSTVTLALTSVSYNDGETVQAATTTTATSPAHTLVASKPTITVAQSTTGGFGNGALKVGEFSVSADAAGDIELVQIPSSITVNGAGTTTVGTVELRDQTGSTVIQGVAAINAQGNFVFSTPRKITKNTSEVYTVYATFSGVSGAAGTQSVTWNIGTAKGSFLWNDVQGAVSNITGAPMFGYPNTTQSKTN